MHPLICHIGPFPVHSYGLMLALALAVSAVLFARDARRLAISSEVIYDLVFWIVLSGLLGARVFYVLLNVDFFMAQPLEIVMLQNGGLAWQGSFAGGFIGGLLFIRKYRLPLGAVLDSAAPFIALGQAIGRIGCLLNGCCYGKAASWGLYFPVWQERLIPTQIFMSLGELTIFLILRHKQPKVAGSGRLFILYVVLSSVERFMIEFFRADHQLYWGLSIFQYVCMALVVAALVVNGMLGKK